MPENLFALALRVIVRRIKEVDTAVDRRLDQLLGLGLANAADGLEEPSAIPECHGSEAEFRDHETGIAERCVFHGGSFPISLGVSEHSLIHRTKKLVGDGIPERIKPCFRVALCPRRLARDKIHRRVADRTHYCRHE